MFSFFHRSSKIHVDCFTYNWSAYENTPIIYANRATPEWWRQLPSCVNPVFESRDNFNYIPKLISETHTLKDCYAIIEFYKKGLVLENWCDYSIKIENDKCDCCWTSGFGAESHAKRQLGNGFPDYHHLKLLSPWKFREKTGIKFMWVGDEWNLHEHSFKILPGITSFDINCSTNINIMLPKIDSTVTIPIGIPLVHIVPLTESKICFKNHLITENEYNNINIDGTLQSFYGWRKSLQLRKRNKERGTCPFGFGDK